MRKKTEYELIIKNKKDWEMTRKNEREMKNGYVEKN